MQRQDFYPGTIDGIVDASKFLDRRRDEALYTLGIGQVNLDRKSSVPSMLSILTALFGHYLGIFLIDICKNNSLGTGFRKCKRGFFADATCGLKYGVSSTLLEFEDDHLLTPVTKAMPPSRVNLDAICN